MSDLITKGSARAITASLLSQVASRTQDAVSSEISELEHDLSRTPEGYSDYEVRLLRSAAMCETTSRALAEANLPAVLVTNPLKAVGDDAVVLDHLIFGPESTSAVFNLYTDSGLEFVISEGEASIKPGTPASATIADQLRDLSTFEVNVDYVFIAVYGPGLETIGNNGFFQNVGLDGVAPAAIYVPVHNLASIIADYFAEAEGTFDPRVADGFLSREDIVIID